MLLHARADGSVQLLSLDIQLMREFEQTLVVQVRWMVPRHYERHAQICLRQQRTLSLMQAMRVVLEKMLKVGSNHSPRQFRQYALAMESHSFLVEVTIKLSVTGLVLSAPLQMAQLLDASTSMRISICVCCNLVARILELHFFKCMHGALRIADHSNTCCLVCNLRTTRPH
jgi:hypothetical protein